VGLPGILLALWILTLKEPVRRERPGVKADADKASIPDTNRFMLSKWRAYGSLIFGFAVLGMVINVYQIWGVQYFVRVLEMPLGEAGTRVGLDLNRYFWSMFNVQKRDRRRGRWRSRDTRPRRSFIKFGKAT